MPRKSRDHPGPWPEGGRLILAVDAWETQMLRKHRRTTPLCYQDLRWADLSEDVSCAYVRRDIEALRTALDDHGMHLYHLIHTRAQEKAS
jgi:hypothetical protein